MEVADMDGKEAPRPRLPQGLVRPGFGLLEMVLVFVMLLAAVAVVFVAYHSAHADAVASREASFISQAIYNTIEATPHGKYKSAGSYWKAARAQGAAWTVSPDGWGISVSGYTTDGPGGYCQKPNAICPTVGAKLTLAAWTGPSSNQDRTASMDMTTCARLMTRLTQHFFVIYFNASNNDLYAGASPKPLSFAHANNVCRVFLSGDHSNGTQLYVVAPW